METKSNLKPEKMCWVAKEREVCLGVSQIQLAMMDEAKPLSRGWHVTDTDLKSNSLPKLSIPDPLCKFFQLFISDM